MVVEEPEAEPCLPSRGSPHRAARPALGSQRPPPSQTVAQTLMPPHSLPEVVHGAVEEVEAGLPKRAAATPTPSLAAIAPTAPEPSIDTAQFRARVTHVRQSRLLTAARSHARARILISNKYTYWLITCRKCTRLNAFERNWPQISKRHVQTRSVNVHNIYELH
jgi:hypothetical protein